MTSTPRRIPRWLKYTLMIFTAFLISLAILRSPIISQDFLNFQNEPAKIHERETFHDLELIDLTGNKVPLSSKHGKVLLVSFWASWCGPCLEELPIFGDLTRKYAENLEVVAINQDDNPEVKEFIDSFWEQHGIPFPTYYDPAHRLAEQVDLQVLPTNFILDRRGRLVFASHGYNDWLSEEAQGFIKSLIEEKY